MTCVREDYPGSRVKPDISEGMPFVKERTKEKE
jgi:hypothetical protein